MTIYEKLGQIQSTLKAPKGQYNDYGKYKYRNCEDILEAVKPILKELKAAIIISDQLEMIGSRYYVKATAKLIDYEVDPVQEIANTAYAREEDTKKGMDGSQITGASSSYARKYALNGLFAIDDTRDSDTTNTGANSNQRAASNTSNSSDRMTEQHYNILIKACGNAKGISNPEQFWKDRYKVKSLADIPDENFDFILTGMKCDRNGNYIGSR